MAVRLGDVLRWRQSETKMGIGATELIIVAVVLVLLFGRGKISGLMGDVANGIKAFKRGLTDDLDTPTGPAAGA